MVSVSVSEVLLDRKWLTDTNTFLVLILHGGCFLPARQSIFLSNTKTGIVERPQRSVWIRGVCVRACVSPPPPLHPYCHSPKASLLNWLTDNKIIQESTATETFVPQSNSLTSAITPALHLKHSAPQQFNREEIRLHINIWIKKKKSDTLSQKQQALCLPIAP